MRPPARFGPYLVVRELARGGMGVVYEAAHEGTGARHALKTVLRGADAEEVARFRREAEVLGRLEHPHIVRVHAADLAGATPWMAQDLLPGGTLKDRLDRGPLAIDEAIALARKLADAIAHAHARGALHRDLKPANVLFDEQGEPRLVDFGLGRSLQEEARRLTATGAVLGTPAFMAPEQALGDRRDDERTDVYGLGALLYAMLAGRAPFEGAGTIAVLNAVLTRPAAPLRGLRPEVPAWLEAVVARSMARDPAERLQDAAALGRALDGGASSRSRRRRPGVGLVVGLGLGLIAVVTALTGGLEGPRPPVPVAARATESSASAPLPPARPMASGDDVARILSALGVGDERTARSLVSQRTLSASEQAKVGLACANAAVNLLEEDSTAPFRAFRPDEHAAHERLSEIFRLIGLGQLVDASLLPSETPLGPLLEGLIDATRLRGSDPWTGELIGRLRRVAPDDPVLVCLDVRLNGGPDPDLTVRAALERLRREGVTPATATVRGELLLVLRRVLSAAAFREEVAREVARDDVHPRALLYAADLALDDGDVARARALFERAAAHRQFGACGTHRDDVRLRLSRRGGG